MSVHGVVELPLESIEVETDELGSLLNPRGPVRDTTDLQASIRENGIRQPLQVRSEVIDGVLRYFLIDGHRRFTAARVLKLDTVPVVVVDVAGGDAALNAMLVSNLQEPFPEVVLDKDGAIVGGMAKAVHRLLANKSYTMEALGRSMGMRPDIVSAYDRLFSAPEPVLRAVAEGRLSMTGFARMKHAPADVQRAVVDRAGEEGDVTVASVRKALREAKQEQQERLAEIGQAEIDIIPTLNDALMALRSVGTEDIGPREWFVIDEIAGRIASMKETKDND